MDFTMIMIVVLIFMFVMMWVQNNRQKKVRGQQDDWRHNLEKGDPVATLSGLVGTVEEVDAARDQIVINSNGYLSRWRLAAIVEPPSVPDYVPDSEVDENGNPLPGVEHVTLEAVPYVPLAVEQLQSAKPQAESKTPVSKTTGKADNDEAYDQFRRMRPFVFDGPISRRD